MSSVRLFSGSVAFTVTKLVYLLWVEKMKLRFAVPCRALQKIALVSLTLSYSLAQSLVYAQLVGTIGLGDLVYSGKEQGSFPKESVVEELSNDLNKSLTETRKFTVLDYAQLESRLSTQNLELRGFYDKRYTSTELQQVGLDYILTAEVTRFDMAEQEPGGNGNAAGLVDIEFKLLGVADATNGFESSVTAQAPVLQQSGEAFDTANMMSKALQQAVDQLVDQVISKLHPIRVMKLADDGVITLNYGSGVLEAGDTIFVYQAGQDIELDPAGKPLGESLATLKVTSTEKKFATAQAIDGFDALEKGQKGQLLLTGG